MWEKKIGRVQFSTTRSKRLTTTAVDCNCYLWSVHSEQSLLLGEAFARVKNNSLKKKKKMPASRAKLWEWDARKVRTPLFFNRLTPRVPRGAPTAIVLLPIFFFWLVRRTSPEKKVLRVPSKVWFTTLPTQQHSIVGRNFAFLYSFHITLCSSCAEETRLAKEAGIPVVKTGYWTWWHVAVVTHTFVLLQVFI